MTSVTHAFEIVVVAVLRNMVEMRGSEADGLAGLRVWHAVAICAAAIMSASALALTLAAPFCALKSDAE